jgi:hypothetical protein
VTLIAGALGGANRRLTPRQNAHAGCASPLATQLSVSGRVRGTRLWAHLCLRTRSREMLFPWGKQTIIRIKWLF